MKPLIVALAILTGASGAQAQTVEETIAFLFYGMDHPATYEYDLEKVVTISHRNPDGSAGFDLSVYNSKSGDLRSKTSLTVRVLDRCLLEVSQKDQYFGKEAIKQNNDFEKIETVKTYDFRRRYTLEQGSVSPGDFGVQYKFRGGPQDFCVKQLSRLRNGTWDFDKKHSCSGELLEEFIFDKFRTYERWKQATSHLQNNLCKPAAF